MFSFNVMKKIILITGIFVSLFLSGKAQMNIPDSTSKTIHLYDSLIFAIEKDTSLQKKNIIGNSIIGKEASKSYKGFAFLVANKNEISKLDLLVDSTDEKRVLIYLHRNRIIDISIDGLNHYIINGNYFIKEETPALDCNKF